MRERKCEADGYRPLLQNPLVLKVHFELSDEVAQGLLAVARAKTDRKRSEYVRDFLKNHNVEIAAVATTLPELLKDPLVNGTEYCKRVFDLENYDHQTEKDEVKKIATYYRHYEPYDQVVFPSLFQIELGEASEVAIVRFSPADAGFFDHETNTQKAAEQIAEEQIQKLAGTKYCTFAGFLSKSWHSNDILWRRVHAAERIPAT